MNNQANITDHAYADAPSIFANRTGGRVATGSQADANRLSRARLSTGRERGYYVVVERGTGRLVWHERDRSQIGCAHVHGYVSAEWAQDQGV